jgi:Nucleoside-diphosphate-sugar epimerases
MILNHSKYYMNSGIHLSRKMKKILIYGSGSYIGNHFQASLEQEGYNVIVVDSKIITPEDVDFSGIDVVIDVAGIAHINITPDMEPLFYKVNTDTAIELCKASKANGVSQFIYMSSMNVYGDTTDKIYSLDQEAPHNFYGRSKWLADCEIHKLGDNYFHVVSLRPPVVYGYNCKGNFFELIKLAKYMLFVPAFRNTKSIIYIDYLSNILVQCIKNDETGILHPQNAEYTSTIDIIKAIRAALGKKTITIYGFNWLIHFLMKINHQFERAFSDDYYDKKFSTYRDNSYNKGDFKKSIFDSVRKLP